MSVAVHASLRCNQRAGSEKVLFFRDSGKRGAKGIHWSVFLSGLMAVLLFKPRIESNKELTPPPMNALRCTIVTNPFLHLATFLKTHIF